ncbi:MAG: YdcF family protein [Actinomycetota bacterium]
MRLLIRIFLLIAAVPILYLGATAAGVWQTSRQDERPDSDAIVVMGAAQYNGTPSVVFKARLDRAAELYRADVAPLIVVLGGKKASDRFTEAQAGAAYLEKEFPADKVTGVKAGTSTLDSLKKFRGLARDRNIHSIVVVSDPLHLARAKAMAKDLGFTAAGSPSSIPESAQRERDNLVNETFKLVFYRLFKEG